MDGAGVVGFSLECAVGRVECCECLGLGRQVLLMDYVSIDGYLEGLSGIYLRCSQRLGFFIHSRLARGLA